jgi:ribosomal protein L37AE/L43A
MKIRRQRVKPGFDYTDSDDENTLVVNSELTSRRDDRRTKQGQIAADAKLAMEVAIAWTAEEDARDNLAGQHERKHDEGKKEEEEADEEEPADDEECHRCEQTGLQLRGSKVTYGAWSCAKCEAELEAELVKKATSEIGMSVETAEDVAGMTLQALVSPETLGRQVDGEVNDGQCEQQLINLVSPDTQERQGNDGQQPIILVSPDTHGQQPGSQPTPPDQHPESDFLRGLGVTVQSNKNSASQIPALKVMDSAYFEPIIAGGATKDVEETEAILRVDSLEVQQLQPWVRDLHAATAALKAAFESSEVTGEARRAQLQNAYIKAADRLCEETVVRCPNRWWPQLFIVAYRAPHPGRVNPLVDPRAVKMAFEGKIDPEVLRTIVEQATYGQEIYLDRRTRSGWPVATDRDHAHGSGVQCGRMWLTASPSCLDRRAQHT